MKTSIPDAARVWQRVHAAAPQEVQTLQAIIQQLSRDQAFLRRYSRAEGLAQEYNEQIHSLLGVLILSGGSSTRLSTAIPPDHCLRKCYDHALQRLGVYQLRSADPVYGPVFRDLSEQTGHHCRKLAELLGSGKEKGW